MAELMLAPNNYDTCAAIHGTFLGRLADAVIALNNCIAASGQLSASHAVPSCLHRRLGDRQQEMLLYQQSPFDPSMAGCSA